MTQEQAQVLAGWKYPGIYAFYDWTADRDDLAELLDPVRRELGGYHAVLDGDGIQVGFFGFEMDGTTAEIGLGLKPALSGRGIGLGLLEAGLDFTRRTAAPNAFRLQVAAFNERAIKVYERAGFQRSRSYRHRTNNSEFDFVEMVRPT